MSSQALSQQEAASELLARRIARSSLLDFTTYTKPDYEVNWHHQVLCDYLDRFVSGEITRMMVFMPPRHGKSELVSRRLPAYILGRCPEANIISCSYSADLASLMNRDVQRIIDSPKYAALFPETRLNQKNVRTDAKSNYLKNSDIFEVINHQGVYRSAGVGGGITGMGCNFGIIDDPIKNREEADSPTYREKVWEWYTSTFYTRLEKDAQILLTMTRWHEDDLAGRILEKEKSGHEEWTIIQFPAIAETPLSPDDPREIGDALWQNKYNEENLAVMKVNQGPFGWASLYQQRPAPPEGELLKKQWWRYYKERPHLSQFDEIIESWDMSFKDTKASSRVCGQVWGRIGANAFLLDEVCDLMDFPATAKAVISLSQKWPRALKKYVEGKANGPAIIAYLKNTVPGLIEVEPDGSKIARASAVSGLIEAGNVWLPDPETNPWVHDFVSECASFPKGKYNDRVDTASQALSRWVLVRPRNPANEPGPDDAVAQGRTSGDLDFFDDDLGGIF